VRDKTCSSSTHCFVHILLANIIHFTVGSTHITPSYELLLAHLSSMLRWAMTECNLMPRIHMPLRRMLYVHLFVTCFALGSTHRACRSFPFSSLLYENVALEDSGGNRVFLVCTWHSFGTLECCTSVSSTPGTAPYPPVPSVLVIGTISRTLCSGSESPTVLMTSICSAWLTLHLHHHLSATQHGFASIPQVISNARHQGFRLSNLILLAVLRFTRNVLLPIPMAAAATAPASPGIKNGTAGTDFKDADMPGLVQDILAENKQYAARFEQTHEPGCEEEGTVDGHW